MRLTTKELQHYWAFQEMCNLKTQYDDIYIYAHTGDHICVYHTPHETIIAIDATDKDAGNKEWESNFRFSPPIQGFHKGFYTTAKYFYGEHIKALVDDLRQSAQLVPIVIVGHSRGGGIAPIVENMLRKDGHGHIRTITFCQPKSATTKGVRQLKKNKVIVHRVEAKLDIVDNVPPLITFRPFSIWKQYETEHYDLPAVEGSDHVEVGAALRELAHG